ncbi:transcription factor-like protein [Rhynchospora pubera]|uniref:Transcription factor-like protein n=1 Tax=Rhynchospora pubera TaxID=906938 RepID=A0AAV8ARK4_9POAL|nr:transcription factor-like protein [Rhynchospora pubera]KAJ4764466.1 transcription factor-like protein [Rhynchospora pubera]KAJ4817175.1 transcription factor-like protein [Rhynchospora pubera]
MEAFYAQWIIDEENILNDLLSVPSDRPDLHIPLISRMLSHCAAYYNRKSQIAERDIFQAFSCYWLTPVERSFLWLGGLKPDMIFRFVPSGLNMAQRSEIEQLRMQMMERRTELDMRMRQVEEAMTVLMALAAVHGYVRNGEARGEATLRIAEILRAVFDEADRLRKYVVTKIIDILNTTQTVRFLAMAVNFHLRTRRYGLRQSGASG